MADITLTQAQQAVDAALNKAKEMGVKMDIAVVDVGANMKTFDRMGEEWLGCMDIEQKTASPARSCLRDSPEPASRRFLWYRSVQTGRRRRPWRYGTWPRIGRRGYRRRQRCHQVS